MVHIQPTPAVHIPRLIIEEAKHLVGQEKLEFLHTTPFQYLSQADRALHYIVKNILLREEPVTAAKCVPETVTSGPNNVDEAGYSMVSEEWLPKCEVYGSMDKLAGEQSFSANSISDDSGLSVEKSQNTDSLVSSGSSAAKVARENLEGELTLYYISVRFISTP